ncbi:hypothetical protein RRG08_020075 [Elysia crispata]|uniref:Uncharacterized protein n=1 Tax=Elysia crispata TaxID=231223 RepID=A0AAE1A4I7_9GAST|nr:hypothetical protein RRG08_020075 [Elysia crispata]
MSAGRLKNFEDLAVVPSFHSPGQADASPSWRISSVPSFQPKQSSSLRPNLQSEDLEFTFRPDSRSDIFSAAEA